MECPHAVVAETLRLHPVNTFLNRRCTLSAGQATYSLLPHDDYAIPDTHCPVLIPIAALHRLNMFLHLEGGLRLRVRRDRANGD